MLMSTIREGATAPDKRSLGALLMELPEVVQERIVMFGAPALDEPTGDGRVAFPGFDNAIQLGLHSDMETVFDMCCMSTFISDRRVGARGSASQPVARWSSTVFNELPEMYLAKVAAAHAAHRLVPSARIARTDFTTREWKEATATMSSFGVELGIFRVEVATDHPYLFFMGTTGSEWHGLPHGFPSINQHDVSFMRHMQGDNPVASVQQHLSSVIPMKSAVSFSGIACASVDRRGRYFVCEKFAGLVRNSNRHGGGSRDCAQAVYSRIFSGDDTARAQLESMHMGSVAPLPPSNEHTSNTNIVKQLCAQANVMCNFLAAADFARECVCRRSPEALDELLGDAVDVAKLRALIGGADRFPAFSGHALASTSMSGDWVVECRMQRSEAIQRPLDNVDDHPGIPQYDQSINDFNRALRAIRPADVPAFLRKFMAIAPTPCWPAMFLYKRDRLDRAVVGFVAVPYCHAWDEATSSWVPATTTQAAMTTKPVVVDPIRRDTVMRARSAFNMRRSAAAANKRAVESALNASGADAGTDDDIQPLDRAVVVLSSRAQSTSRRTYEWNGLVWAMHICYNTESETQVGTDVTAVCWDCMGDRGDSTPRQLQASHLEVDMDSVRWAQPGVLFAAVRLDDTRGAFGRMDIGAAQTAFPLAVYALIHIDRHLPTDAKPVTARANIYCVHVPMPLAAAKQLSGWYASGGSEAERKMEKEDLSSLDRVNPARGVVVRLVDQRVMPNGPTASGSKAKQQVVTVVSAITGWHRLPLRTAKDVLGEDCITELLDWVRDSSVVNPLHRATQRDSFLPEDENDAESSHMRNARMVDGAVRRAHRLDMQGVRRRLAALELADSIQRDPDVSGELVAQAQRGLDGDDEQSIARQKAGREAMLQSFIDLRRFEDQTHRRVPNTAEDSPPRARPGDRATQDQERKEAAPAYAQDKMGAYMERRGNRIRSDIHASANGVSATDIRNMQRRFRGRMAAASEGEAGTGSVAIPPDRRHDVTDPVHVPEETNAQAEATAARKIRYYHMCAAPIRLDVPLACTSSVKPDTTLAGSRRLVIGTPLPIQHDLVPNRPALTEHHVVVVHSLPASDSRLQQVVRVGAGSSRRHMFHGVPFLRRAGGFSHNIVMPRLSPDGATLVLKTIKAVEMSTVMGFSFAPMLDAPRHVTYIANHLSMWRVLASDTPTPFHRQASAAPVPDDVAPWAACLSERYAWVCTGAPMDVSRITPIDAAKAPPSRQGDLTVEEWEWAKGSQEIFDGQANKHSCAHNTVSSARNRTDANFLGRLARCFLTGTSVNSARHIEPRLWGIPCMEGVVDVTFSVGPYNREGDLTQEVPYACTFPYVHLQLSNGGTLKLSTDPTFVPHVNHAYTVADLIRAEADSRAREAQRWLRQTGIAGLDAIRDPDDGDGAGAGSDDDDDDDEAKGEATQTPNALLQQLHEERQRRQWLRDNGLETPESSTDGDTPATTTPLTPPPGYGPDDVSTGSIGLSAAPLGAVHNAACWVANVDRHTMPEYNDARDMWDTKPFTADMPCTDSGGYIAFVNSTRKSAESRSRRKGAAACIREAAGVLERAAASVRLGARTAAAVARARGLAVSSGNGGGSVSPASPSPVAEGTVGDSDSNSKRATPSAFADDVEFMLHTQHKEAASSAGPPTAAVHQLARDAVAKAMRHIQGQTLWASNRTMCSFANFLPIHMLSDNIVYADPAVLAIDADDVADRLWWAGMRATAAHLFRTTDRSSTHASCLARWLLKRAPATNVRFLHPHSCSTGPDGELVVDQDTQQVLRAMYADKGVYVQRLMSTVAPYIRAKAEVDTSRPAPSAAAYLRTIQQRAFATEAEEEEEEGDEADVHTDTHHLIGSALAKNRPQLCFSALMSSHIHRAAMESHRPRLVFAAAETLGIRYIPSFWDTGSGLEWVVQRAAVGSHPTDTMTQNVEEPARLCAQQLRFSVGKVHTEGRVSNLDVEHAKAFASIFMQHHSMATEKMAWERLQTAYSTLLESASDDHMEWSLVGQHAGLTDAIRSSVLGIDTHISSTRAAAMVTDANKAALGQHHGSGLSDMTQATIGLHVHGRANTPPIKDLTIQTSPLNMAAAISPLAADVRHILPLGHPYAMRSTHPFNLSIDE